MFCNIKIKSSVQQATLINIPVQKMASQIARVVSQRGRAVKAHMNHWVTYMSGWMSMASRFWNKAGWAWASSAENSCASCCLG